MKSLLRGIMSTVMAFCCAAPTAGFAQQVETLVSFNWTDGAYPSGPLLIGANGSLYGTADGAVVNSENCWFFGCGTIFQVTPEGRLTTLYTFCVAQTLCADGASPNGGLFQTANGVLYGTTYSGGTGAYCKYSSGCGTIFKITPSGKLTTLYSFCSQTGCADGEFPYGSLVQDRSGNFYGTTSDGGVPSTCTTGVGCGTVFQFTSGGKLKTLYQFCSQNNCVDGYLPANGVVLAPDGNLYGTTNEGGQTSNGTIFRLAISGKLTTLYSFCSQPNCADGLDPYAELLQASNGNWYGATRRGGANGNGTIFLLTRTGKLNTLYSFCSQSNCIDGEFPEGLIRGNDGNLYGTTLYGGTDSGACGGYGCGTIFKISAAGKLDTLYSFCSEVDCMGGEVPDVNMVRSTNGNL